MLNWVRTNVTVMLESHPSAPRLFWGIGRTAAHLGLRVWGERHLYIGIGDAS